MNEKIKIIEDIVAGYAGPITPYIIKKTMKDFNLKDDIPLHLLSKFIDVVIERAILNPEIHMVVKKRIISSLKAKKFI